MTPIVQLYWIRVVLGIVAGAISAVVAFLLVHANDITTLVNGFTVALIIYLIIILHFESVIQRQNRETIKNIQHSNSDVLFRLVTILCSILHNNNSY